MHTPEDLDKAVAFYGELGWPCEWGGESWAVLRPRHPQLRLATKHCA
jgi:hypothetical protein